jgi:hypothetical protein
MVTRTVCFGDADAREVHARLVAVIESTPPDAVLQLRFRGAVPAMPTAAALRAMAGVRNVTVAIRMADRRNGNPNLPSF